MNSASSLPLPTWRTAALAAGALCALTGCGDLQRLIDLTVPSTVEGVPHEGSWLALPIRSWVTEGGVTSEALAACFDQRCSPHVAVGVFRASGAAAQELASILDHPEKLRLTLDRREARKAAAKSEPVKTVASVEPRRAGALKGFAVSLARADGMRPVHGVVLGASAKGALRFVMVIGEHADEVEATARTVAAGNLGGA